MLGRLENPPELFALLQPNSNARSSIFLCVWNSKKSPFFLSLLTKNPIHEEYEEYTEVFGSTGFGNNEISGITDILAIPKFRFCIKKVGCNGFSGVTGKMTISKWSGTSENLCIYTHYFFTLTIKQSRLFLSRWEGKKAVGFLELLRIESNVVVHITVTGCTVTVFTPSVSPSAK